MELEKSESSEGTLLETEASMTSNFFSLTDLMGRENSSTSLRFWLREAELSDGWGSGSATARQATSSSSPFAGFESPQESKSTQKTLRRARCEGRCAFQCFRRKSLNLALPEFVPNKVLPAIEQVAPPCASGAAHCALAYIDEVSDHQHQSNNGHFLEEPTSPIVNCIGQVRTKKMRRQRATSWSPYFTK